MRLGENITITRRNCRLGCIQENDLIETKVSKNERCTPLASIELPVHRAIYKETNALAIVHAHPPHAIVLSLIQEEIKPVDSEGVSMLGRIPVLGIGMEVKPGSLANLIAESLKENNIVMVRGHGSFAKGQLLEDAYDLTTRLEDSALIICLLKSLQVKPNLAL